MIFTAGMISMSRRCPGSSCRSSPADGNR
jgi:hypothetical protein